MLYKLFTGFDYNSFINIKFIIIMSLFFIFSNFYFFSSFNILVSFILSSYSRFNEWKLKFKGFSYSIFRFFLFLFIVKIIGLFPYVFSPTSHFFFIIFYSLLFWSVIFISSLFFSPIIFFSFLTPSGRPVILVPLLKIIELIRKLIRPLTLSLRLSINITTGHIFIVLLSTYMSVLFFRLSILYFIFLFFCVSYFFFEIFVSFIQAFVYSLLLNQYMGEHS